jgi:hypothetical protein
MTLKIYSASSWRNKHYPDIVTAMRANGHEVYDFRAANNGFRWSCQTWPEHIEQLKADLLVAAAFKRDKDALDWCDVLVLLRPCGISAHLEAMYASGKGKPVVVLFDSEPFGPEKCELMYKLLEVGAGGVRFVTDIAELLTALRAHKQNAVIKPTDDKIRGLVEYALKLSRNDVASAIRFLGELGLPFADACAAVEDVAALDEAQPSQCDDPVEGTL